MGSIINTASPVPFPKQALLEEGWTARALVEQLAHAAFLVVAPDGGIYGEYAPLRALGILEAHPHYATRSVLSDFSLREAFGAFCASIDDLRRAWRKDTRNDSHVTDAMVARALTDGVYLQRAIKSSSLEWWVPAALTERLDEDLLNIARIQRGMRLSASRSEEHAAAERKVGENPFRPTSADSKPAEADEKADDYW